MVGGAWAWLRIAATSSGQGAQHRLNRSTAEFYARLLSPEAQLHAALAEGAVPHDVAGFRIYLTQVRGKALAMGVSAATLDAVFPTLTPSPRVIRLDQSQPAGPVGTDDGDLLLARFLTASGEAFLTGMLVAIFVAYRPQWLATYADRIYLPR